MNARQSFEKWLVDRFKQNQPYDLTARELILLVRKPAEPGAPNAFTAYHGNKPEDQSGAIARASDTLQGLGWFKVKELRGFIHDGEFSEYQVSLELGFRLLREDELKKERSS